MMRFSGDASENSDGDARALIETETGDASKTVVPLGIANDGRSKSATVDATTRIPRVHSHS